jgi:hypothetical protein
MLDRKHFYQNYKKHFGSLTQNQVDSINLLLGFIDKDLGTELINNLQQAAYILATVKHETANTFAPISEYGKGRGRVYGKPDPKTGKVYYGRGYVQLTWLRNYQTMSDILNIDLVGNPDLALLPQVAYNCLVIGLDRGIYGLDLDKAIPARGLKEVFWDFVLARKSVNGTDKARLIAGYADKFLMCLKEI